jgi:hypothetical protein
MVETVSGSIRVLGGTEIALCLATARKGQQATAWDGIMAGWNNCQFKFKREKTS